MKLLLAIALVLCTATVVSAQAVGNWQRVHGEVQGLQGNQLAFRADDGRMLWVDIASVSQSVHHALAPSMGATLVGFPGDHPNRFTARYIIQDSAHHARRTPAATRIDRVVTLIPQFLDSQEFQDLRRGLRANPAAARVLVTQLYQGFLERSPSLKERDDWVAYLGQTGDMRSLTEYFVKSPEYVQKGKNEGAMIGDLYEALLGRTASSEEIRGWEQQLAQN